jgi:hypothetical protein
MNAMHSPAVAIPGVGVRRLTVVKGTNSSLALRRSAVDSDVRRIARAVETRDSLMTFDRNTIDSAGAFLVGELERLDPRMHAPLASVTWGRDIDLREDVTIADETSSFTNSGFAAVGGIGGSNKAWVGKDTNAIASMALDIGKTALPLNLWAMQLGWTIPELASAQKLGRPVDQQKFDGMQLKYQMDIDEQVYIGDTLLGLNGLLNHASLGSTGNAVTGGWGTATPAQMLGDVNAILTSVWAATGYALMPTDLRLTPIEYSIAVSTLISTAGNISVLEFLRKNNIAGAALNIQPLKWLTGTNNSGKGPTATNSMFAYVKDPTRVRFPLVPLQRTPVEYRDLRQLTTYFGRLGCVELVYGETAARRSNLG